MRASWVGADGRIHLPDYGNDAEWSSCEVLAADYWRYQRLSGREREADPMAAWVCIRDLLSAPAWEKAVELIDALLRSASAEHEVALVAAGPLEDLFGISGDGHRFIDDVERRAHQGSLWAAALHGMWLDREADPGVNRRLGSMGAAYADGTQPV